MGKFIVITTINAKSQAIIEFEKRKDWHLIIVGDKKSQPIQDSKNLTFLSVEKQQTLGFTYVEHCPFNHYARKNIGYLYALKMGATMIYDTDDDNLPYPEWSFPEFACHSGYSSQSQFVNVYRHFTQEFIWPRGLPLQEINPKTLPFLFSSDQVQVGVWQGLVDNDPDVDAIHRLIFNKQITFLREIPVYIPQGKFCPFNSQNTLWNSALFLLLYLPVSVSFRFTDILRGYIAQKLMWQSGYHLGFIPSNVYQLRNAHNLMTDFSQEIVAYLRIVEISGLLSKIDISNDLSASIFSVYQGLLRIGVVDQNEVAALAAWIKDFKHILNER